MQRALLGFFFWNKSFWLKSLSANGTMVLSHVSFAALCHGTTATSQLNCCEELAQKKERGLFLWPPLYIVQ
jgi:hypothetical protein